MKGQSLVFSIGAYANKYNKELLKKIKDFFNVGGSISKVENMFYFEVSSLKSLKSISNHFLAYPLQSTKSIYFQLWCKVLDILITKEDLDLKKFLTILSIKTVFPKGLNKNLVSLYPNIISIEKPEFIPSKEELNPYWIAGFVNGDGSFGLNYTKVKRMKLGYTCQPQFRICQHKRDKELLYRILISMDCGNMIAPSPDRDRYGTSVSKLEAITKKIIPFFITYEIYGTKRLDFEDFCQGISIIEKGGHLTPEGWISGIEKNLL